MRIKRFAGATEAEAMAQVRLELGPNAVILETRRLREGLFGVLGKGGVEVLAAVEESAKQAPSFAQNLEIAAVESAPKDKAHIAAATAVLLQQGVDPALAFDISEKIVADDTQKAVDQTIESLLARATVRPAYRRGTVAALVGPTGSGKTTTAAKMCAIAALRCNLRVLWLAADTFRVGGVEQAQTYAEIMNVPLEVCATPESVTAAIRAYPDTDYVIVDTTGRSHLNPQQVAEISRSIGAARPTETYLTIPASSGWLQVQDILKGFAPTGFNRLIITKLDETTRAGTLLNLAGLCPTPMAYFTTGQTVPDDISAVSVEAVRNVIARGRRP